MRNSSHAGLFVTSSGLFCIFRMRGLDGIVEIQVWICDILEELIEPTPNFDRNWCTCVYVVTVRYSAGFGFIKIV